MELPTDLAEERYCVLSTSGRQAGRRHSAELWFVPAVGGVCLMSGSGGLTQWCRNLEADGQGVLRIADRAWLARSAFLSRADPLRATALERFHERYDPPGKDRRPAWRRDAAVVHLVFTRDL